MSRYVSESLRLIVASRAGHRCEYYGIPQLGRFIQFHVEHIRSIKHGGETEEHNLAFSCSFCNFFKGSDLGTFLDDDRLIRFFNPRKDVWTDHFSIENGVVTALTEIGEATLRIFQFNTPERIIYRQELSSLLDDSL